MLIILIFFEVLVLNDNNNLSSFPTSLFEKDLRSFLTRFELHFDRTPSIWINA